MTWILLPLASFTAMACQDILATVMVQAEASCRPRLAGVMDMAQDACNLVSLAVIGGSVFVGHNIGLSAASLGARLAADYFGTYAGVRIGQRIMHREEIP